MGTNKIGITHSAKEAEIFNSKMSPKFAVYN